MNSTSKPNLMQIGDGKVKIEKTLGDWKWNDPMEKIREDPTVGPHSIAWTRGKN